MILLLLLVEQAEFCLLGRNYRRNSPQVRFGHPVKHKDPGSGCHFLCPSGCLCSYISGHPLCPVLKALHLLRLQTNICEGITNVQMCFLNVGLCIFFSEIIVCDYISHILLVCGSLVWDVYETLKGSAHSPRALELSVFFCPSLWTVNTFLPLADGRCNTHFKHASLWLYTQHKLCIKPQNVANMQNI